MRVHDLAVTFVDSFQHRNLLSDEVVQAGYVYAGAALMVVQIVITDVRKEVAVIEDANSRQLVVRVTHPHDLGARLSLQVKLSWLRQIAEADNGAAISSGHCSISAGLREMLCRLLMELPVILSSGEDGYLVAECRVIPGCISQGCSCEEAIETHR
jgi:hypothetical protein